MKRIFLAALWAGMAGILCQCGMTHSIDRTDAEAWNEGVVWKPWHGSGRDFVPKDLVGTPLAGPGRGEWVVDPQDDYRFYVPAAGTRKFTQGMLLAEAGKATNRLTHAQQSTRNTVKTVLFPVIAAGTLFTPAFWQSASSGGGGDVDSSSPVFDDSTTTDDRHSRQCHDHGGSHGHEGKGGSCKSDSKDDDHHGK